jgi:hypothetical protein
LGADQLLATQLLATMQADTLIAGRAFDAIQLVGGAIWLG